MTVKRLPEFITFTGVDDWTDVAGLRDLSQRYAIEWGMLFSPKRQGQEPRYPGGEAQSRFLWADGLRRSAHLCGGWARNVMAGEKLEGIPVDLAYFDRVQVNHPDPHPTRMNVFSRGWGSFRCIAQCRGSFPSHDAVDWLADASGGYGIVPARWPAHPGGDVLVGYAGGLRPDNVVEQLEKIDATGRYWIDMESGIRTDDRLDLTKCRAVCEAVYGRAGEKAAA